MGSNQTLQRGLSPPYLALSVPMQVICENSRRSLDRVEYHGMHREGAGRIEPGHDSKDVKDHSECHVLA